MAKSSTLVEPVRMVPTPRPDRDGNLLGAAVLSPTKCTTRAALPIPPSKVIPIIVVPGIMGSNLRAKKNANGNRNALLKPGETAWRPPNDALGGIKEASVWKGRLPAARQQILDPDSLEVDPTGQILPTPDLAEDPKHLYDDGWGEIHWGSYGGLLVALKMRLNVVFRNWTSRDAYTQWERLNHYDRARWNTTKSGVCAELTEAELKKLASYHYPVYAFGYNWLQSNEQSAAALRARIEGIKKLWNDAKQDCKQVILVTHSMGGLVGRACAKQIPDQIAGIVHGVMPALGAPVCYRRIACGTESHSPSNGMLADLVMGKVADIVGRTAEATTAVMSTAPGPLELLPSHLYPEPWLFVSVRGQNGESQDKALFAPAEAYDFYRDTACWYRMIDPALADPADRHRGDIVTEIASAIKQAERFHKEILGSYYHPKTYAFYGADVAHRSYGTCRWVGQITDGKISVDSLQRGKLISRTGNGDRNVESMDGRNIVFQHSIQDVPGDGTVPQRSGAGPTGKVTQTFATVGYDHQGSYADEAMLLLTQHLIAKIVQEAK